MKITQSEIAAYDQSLKKVSKPMKTQDECGVDWILARETFLHQIEKIDKATPATPTEEPAWWAEMMEIHRFIGKTCQ